MLNKMTKSIAVVVVVACSVALPVYAPPYACNVLTQQDCASGTCKVGNLTGTITQSSKTDNCADGSPGWTICTGKAKLVGEEWVPVMQDCIYTCTVQPPGQPAQVYPGRKTSVPVMELLGNGC
jgi:hypothetical protein